MPPDFHQYGLEPSSLLRMNERHVSCSQNRISMSAMSATADPATGLIECQLSRNPHLRPDRQEAAQSQPSSTACGRMAANGLTAGWRILSIARGKRIFVQLAAVPQRSNFAWCDRPTESRKTVVRSLRPKTLATLSLRWIKDIVDFGLNQFGPDRLIDAANNSVDPFPWSVEGEAA